MGNIALTDVIPQDSLERQLYFIEKCKAYVADLQEKLGRPLTCCTQTFGCQKKPTSCFTIPVPSVKMPTCVYTDVLAT